VKSSWTIAAAVPLLVATVAGGEEWRAVTSPLSLTFPADHGAHPDHRTEWWYVTGLVADPAGRRFGYQLTFFRQGVRPGQAPPGASELDPRQALAAHLAVADLRNGRLHHAQRLRRAAVGLAGFATGDLHVWVEDWELQRHHGDVLTLTAADRGADVALHLRLEPTRPLTRHGEGGVSRKGDEPGNASAYLTWTRLATAGTLHLEGRTFTVTGESWLDHEWGSTQLGTDVVGWDWLGVRLADGRDLMVYRLRRADGSASPHSAGTVVSVDGSTLALGAADLEFVPLTSWTSPRTGAAYPARLRLRIPRAGLDLEVAPLLADAEIDGRSSTGVVYWEGPVAISGSTTGEGYLELTGYAAPLTGRL
jgi:predicted secreted hydrolase